MAQEFTNQASALLVADIVADDTAIQVQSGLGSLFPAVDPGDPDAFAIMTIEDDAGNIEIVRMTGRSTDIMQIERGYEDTTALDFTVAAGARVDLRVTAETLRHLQDAGGVGEAPIDGNPYNRQDAQWVLDEGGLEEAPTDGLRYGRKDEAWVDLDALGKAFLAPVVPPTVENQLVAFSDDTGVQAADPRDELVHTGTKLSLGNHRLFSNGIAFDIESISGGGTTVHILPNNSAASISIVVPADGGPADPIYIQSAGAPLELIAPDIYINDMKWPHVGDAVQGAYMTAISETELAFVATSGDTPILFQGGDTPGGAV